MKQPNKKKVGRPRVETEVYFRRIHPSLIKPMDEHLEMLKSVKISNN